MSVCVNNHVISLLKNTNSLTKKCLSKYDFPFKNRVGNDSLQVVFLQFTERKNLRKNILERDHFPARAHIQYIEICSLAYTFLLTFSRFLVDFRNKKLRLLTVSCYSFGMFPCTCS